MNKICTSIEQSQKLIDLEIDVNTADMYYFDDHYNLVELKTNFSYENYLLYKHDKFDYIPAWSLNSLLKLIPNWQMQTQDNGIGILFGCKECIKIIDADTPIDASFEMVVWLKENKKL